MKKDQRSAMTESGTIALKKPQRRRFLKDVCLAGGLAVAPAFVRSLSAGWMQDSSLASSVFTLGVASGDPKEDSVVLWTRLAPDPLNGGGMGNKPLDVLWQVATDPAMVHVVRSGSAASHPKNGHSVVVNVDGLESNTWYYYQFSYSGQRSRIGRTRTFPAPGTTPSQLRFAVVSCQHFESGFYAAYRDISTQPLDLIVHVGDYIYEGGANAGVPAERRHNGGEIVSVADYRNRYALYRMDSHLQNAHASFPFVTTWDDHEVDNNYASLIPEDNQTPAEFLERRTNAYQVYLETMPLRPNVHEKKGAVNLFRSLRYGSLAEFFVLDTRQHRTDQPCGDNFQVLQACPAILDEFATITGSDQEVWLSRGLRNSKATWNVIAQQVMMMRWDLGVLAGSGLNVFNVDAWDGYQAERNRLMAFLGNSQIQNAVVLTGDIHSSWAADLKMDFTSANSPIVGTEFVCSSITSTFGDANHGLVRFTLPSNPHIKFFDGLHRGYVLCTVTADEWRSDFRAVTRPAVPNPIFTVPSADMPVFTLASYALLNGEPGLKKLL